LWPNFVAACANKKIPVCLLNARLSEKSAAGYRQVQALTKEMLKNVDSIAAHAKADAERFIALGAKPENVSVAGSIKFDLMIPADLTEKAAELRSQLGKDKFIWIAASTHEGEEEIILAAHKHLLTTDKDALLILVPRHPERFDAIATLCAQHFVTSRRSQKTIEPNMQVYLADTMGEMLLFYQVADVTFVGGSLIQRGGHNLLEPAALQKPVLSGPHLFNFIDISQLLLQGKALIIVNNENELATEVVKLAQDANARTTKGQAAKAVVDANRGALAKQLAVVNGFLQTRLPY
jgi:3-deoxy-D-manno-octulosonic-acid transferase